MSLPFRFGELTVRFASVRAWVANQPSSGDHWDLSEGFALVAEKISISGNTHKGTLNFWRAP